MVNRKNEIYVIDWTNRTKTMLYREKIERELCYRVKRQNENHVIEWKDRTKIML